jgi:hypothetical protein
MRACRAYARATSARAAPINAWAWPSATSDPGFPVENDRFAESRLKVDAGYIGRHRGTPSRVDSRHHPLEAS